MYNIPINFNLEKLLGSLITQISYSINTISIFFDKVGFITISGSFRINHKKFYDEIFPIKNDMGLLNMLGKKIINININNDRDILCIVLDNQLKLELIGNKVYESYTINIGGTELIV